MPDAGGSSSSSEPADPFLDRLLGLEARMARLDKRMAGSSIRERRQEALSQGDGDAFELRIKNISNAKR